MALRVSILIPAFNSRSTIRDTLRSAIDQTWHPKEIIVVNDGSSDDTGAIAKEFAPEGVTVLTQSHAGAAAARNNAFSASSGDYIQWLDADDLLAPDKIEQQMRALGRCSDRTVFSCPYGRFWYRPSRAEFTPTSLWCDLAPLEWILRKMEENVFMQTATWLVPRRLVESAGPWDLRLLGDDDGEYFCRVLLLADRICFVPGAKVFYRRPAASASIAASDSLGYIGLSQAKMETQLLSMRLHIQHLLSLEDSVRARRACIQYLKNSLMCFYPDRPDFVAAASQLARELGGELQPPRFSWKYAWLSAACGPRVAKRAQVLLPKLRWSLVAGWDKAMHRLERVTLARRPGVAV